MKHLVSFQSYTLQSQDTQEEELAMKSGVGLNFVRNTDISMLDRMLPSMQKDWESPESYEEVVSYFIDFVSIVILRSSIFSSLLWRRLLHLQEHGGGS